MIALGLHLSQMHDVDRPRGNVAGASLLCQNAASSAFQPPSVKRLK